MDNELVLYDRINVIRDVIKKHGEENFYLSFSGGKDSAILHHLIDEAMPNNKIPRVYINTGIEYVDIVKYVKLLKEKDNRIEIINSNINIPQMLERVGYPFKSKEHSHKVNIFANNGITKAVKKYLDGITNDGQKSMFECPKILKYQFTDQFKLKVSEKCCNELKKKTVHRYEKVSTRSIAIVGLRTSEGGKEGISPHVLYLIHKEI